MVKSEPKKKLPLGGFFQKFFRKPEKSEKEQRLTVQRSIPYLEMGRDGICRVEEHLYSKTVRFYDINYQLAQNEDKNTIFESWCDFLNYFDASIRFQLSFIIRWWKRWAVRSFTSRPPVRTTSTRWTLTSTMQTMITRWA